jgi:hypothetical protein
VSTKEPAFAVYIKLGPLGSKFASHVKGTCDLLEYLVVSEDRIGYKVVLIRLELALVLIVIHLP